MVGEIPRRCKQSTLNDIISIICLFLNSDLVSCSVHEYSRNLSSLLGNCCYRWCCVLHEPPIGNALKPDTYTLLGWMENASFMFLSKPLTVLCHINCSLNKVNIERGHSLGVGPAGACTCMVFGALWHNSQIFWLHTVRRPKISPFPAFSSHHNPACSDQTCHVPFIA